MAESTLNKNSDKKNGIEDNNTVAQRFLNIFRQLHVFTPERKKAFDDLILSQPPEIRGMFGKLMGGNTLQEYVHELENRSGMEHGSSEESHESQILNNAIKQNTQIEEPVANVNNSQIQAQLLEMMSKMPQYNPTQVGFDAKGLETLVTKLMKSQSELLASISTKQTEQLSRIISLSLQESYRSSTSSFISAIREMNSESLRTIREALEHQSNKPIVLSNYINNPTQINAGAQQPSSSEQNRRLEEMEIYAKNQNQNLSIENVNDTAKKKKKKNKNKNKKKNKNKEKDFSIQASENDFDELFLDDDEIENDDFSGHPVGFSSSENKDYVASTNALDPSLFDDGGLDDGYVYEEHYIEEEPKKAEIKPEEQEKLKDKILNKAKKLLKGGNSDHLNFDINSIDDIIKDKDLVEDPIFSEEKLEIPVTEENHDEEWEWVEDEATNEGQVANESADLTQTYIQEDDDFINIGEENLPSEDASDEEWEWVEEQEDVAGNAAETQAHKENEWVWEYDNSQNPEEEEEWIWEYEEVPEEEKSLVDAEPIAFEEKYYEPEGKHEEKTAPLSSKGILEKESRFKFDDVPQSHVPVESQTANVSDNAVIIEPEDVIQIQETIEPEKPKKQSLSNEILGNMEESGENETVVNVGDLTTLKLNIEQDKNRIIEDIENINDNYLYNGINNENDNLDDVYNK
ncbi:MAG: hypothetical protein ACK5N8_07040 [Alphaproteobacteria bacterium]